MFHGRCSTYRSSRAPCPEIQAALSIPLDPRSHWVQTAISAAGIVAITDDRGTPGDW